MKDQIARLGKVRLGESPVRLWFIEIFLEDVLKAKFLLMRKFN